jgi:enoyl-CoA hydratase
VGNLGVRQGVPLIDGGTVRLPRLVGEGRARDIILTGRKVNAQECYRIGLCERLAPDGEARRATEDLAQELARLPQICPRADRRSIGLQEGRSERDALRSNMRTVSAWPPPRTRRCGALCRRRGAKAE